MIIHKCCSLLSFSDRKSKSTNLQVFMNNFFKYFTRFSDGFGHSWLVWFLNCTNSKHSVLSDLPNRCITKYIICLELLFYSFFKWCPSYSGVNSNRRAAILNDVINRYCLFYLYQLTWCLSFRKTPETCVLLVPNLKTNTFTFT